MTFSPISASKPGGGNAGKPENSAPRYKWRLWKIRPLSFQNQPLGGQTRPGLAEPAKSEAEHFMPCPNCGVPLALRDLGGVLEHDTPLHIELGGRKKRTATNAVRSAKSTRKWA